MPHPQQDVIINYDDTNTVM